MTQDLEDRIVRYGDLQPCKTAFIDAHTPGSDQKENFTIIGGGVSESPDQHVHISIPHGFNIGAAGQPPRVRNSLHDHHTAEAFFVLKGTWRFFWGRWGDAGEVVLQEGDIVWVPPTPMAWVGHRVREILQPVGPAIQLYTTPAVIEDASEVYDDEPTQTSRR